MVCCEGARRRKTVKGRIAHQIDKLVNADATSKQSKTTTKPSRTNPTRRKRLKWCAASLVRASMRRKYSARGSNDDCLCKLFFVLCAWYFGLFASCVLRSGTTSDPQRKTKYKDQSTKHHVPCANCRKSPGLLTPRHRDRLPHDRRRQTLRAREILRHQVRRQR